MKMKNILRLLLCSVCGLLFSCFDYVKAEYDPLAISQEIIGDFPESHFIEGLTWISSNKAYCIPTCMQMIGEWKGIKKPVSYYNWLMGNTYGAFYKDSFTSFMPLADPIKGIMFASKYLGLHRFFYSTEKQELCVKAIKTFISKGYPVFVMIDYNVFTDDDFFFPHAELLVGYDRNTFYYYEPGFSDRFTQGKRGLKAPISTMMKGIYSLSTYKQVPSNRYFFMIFKDDVKKTDIKAVWKRNAGLLKGKKIAIVNLADGAKAVKSLAADIRNKRVPEWGFKHLLPLWFKVGSYSRKDNALFIRNTFPQNQTLQRVAELFLEASRYYNEIVRLLENSKTATPVPEKKIAEVLVLIAQKEQKIATMLESLQ